MFEVKAQPRQVTRFEYRDVAFMYARRVSQKSGWAGVWDSVTDERWTFYDGVRQSSAKPGVAK